MGIKKILTKHFTEEERKAEVEAQALEKRQKLLADNKEKAKKPQPLKVGPELRCVMKDTIKDRAPEYCKDEGGYNMFTRFMNKAFSEESHTTVRYPVFFDSDDIDGSPYIILKCPYFPDATCVVLSDDAMSDAQVLIDYLVCISLDVMGRVPKSNDVTKKNCKMIKCSFKVPGDMVHGGVVWFRK